MLCPNTLLSMRLCQPPDGSTSPKYKLVCFITTKKCKEKNALAFNQDRCCHLGLCLRLIPFHCKSVYWQFIVTYMSIETLLYLHLWIFLLKNIHIHIVLCKIYFVANSFMIEYAVNRQLLISSLGSSKLLLHLFIKVALMLCFLKVCVYLYTQI